MKVTELKRWPEICKYLQEQGYAGYLEQDIHIGRSAGKFRSAIATVIDKWGISGAVDITPYVNSEEIEPLKPQPLPQGYAPLDCE